jgi:hypothetical protein
MRGGDARGWWIKRLLCAGGPMLRTGLKGVLPAILGKEEKKNLKKTELLSPNKSTSSGVATFNRTHKIPTCMCRARRADEMHGMC